MVVEINEQNFPAVADMSVRLWPDCDPGEMKDHVEQVLHAHDATCFLLQEEDGYIGFIELSVRRDHVEGAESMPVAYIEGLFIAEGFRHKGYGRLLVEVAASWARAKGFTQLCSDAELENHPSIAFHQSLGFREASRVVCFVTNL
jgi:aminoglycoside 6'-N-acetyltransferase I